MNPVHTIIDSPVGPIVVVRENDMITRTSVLHQRHLPDATMFGPRDDRSSRDAAEQFAQYFAGERREFDLPLLAEGTEFQRRVWRALSEIPYGETRSYGELATAIGQPTAVRAVGLANGRNPHGIVVPCHRVIGANGTLIGYAGGLAMKRTLLDLEGAHYAERGRAA